MGKIGVFYGSSTGNTKKVARLIGKRLGLGPEDIHDICNAAPGDLDVYDVLLLGTSTWGLGDLQDDWDDFLPSLKKVDFEEKKVALFGLGDQESYAETFVDALGMLYRQVIKRGALVIGEWSTEGYAFDRSRAVIQGDFVGLVIDEDNEPELTEERVTDWTEMITSDL